MIPHKIEVLFNFIDYLHSNIENFNQYNNIIKELDALFDERDKLRPEKNYKEKERFKIVQQEFESKFEILQNFTAIPIIEKAKELNVCSYEKPAKFNFFGIENEIRLLKEQYTNEDIAEIIKHKNKYIEYRTQTHNSFYSLEYFYCLLDRICEDLFNFFCDETKDEFKPIETKKRYITLSELIQKNTISWKIEYEPLIKYLKENYIDVHPAKMTLERLHQIKRNVIGFRDKLLLENTQNAIECRKYLETILSGIESKINGFPNQQINDETNIKKYSAKQDIEPLPPQPIIKQKPEQETPKTFDELFYNTDLVKPCIDILKELDPPLIDTDCNYIGKLKGVFCVWIDEMQRQGIVKHYSDRKIFASLIPQKIKRFSIDESMFGKYQSKAENLYRTDIKTMVSKIKLSQNSH